MEGDRKTKPLRMSPAAQEVKASHGLKSTPKITLKREDFRSKQEHQEHPKLRFFKGNPTWFLHRGGLRPPSLFLISTRN
jgi:hypothetical protein